MPERKPRFNEPGYPCGKGVVNSWRRHATPAQNAAHAHMQARTKSFNNMLRLWVGDYWAFEWNEAAWITTPARKDGRLCREARAAWRAAVMAP